MREDPGVRAYFEGESVSLPAFFRNKMQRDLGPFWEALPAGALEHDAYAYLNSVEVDPPEDRAAPSLAAAMA